MSSAVCTCCCYKYGVDSYMCLQMKLLSIHTGHSVAKIDEDTARTRYFNPYEAIEYKLIDRVLDPTAEELRAIAEASTYN